MSRTRERGAAAFGICGVALSRRTSKIVVEALVEGEICTVRLVTPWISAVAVYGSWSTGAWLLKPSRGSHVPWRAPVMPKTGIRQVAGRRKTPGSLHVSLLKSTPISHPVMTRLHLCYRVRPRREGRIDRNRFTPVPRSSRLLRRCLGC